jgi:hypothetical protein
MGSIKIAGKNIVTQSGSDEPTIASNVVFPAGHVLQVQSTNWNNSNQISDTGNITETLSYENNSLSPLSEVTITPQELTLGLVEVLVVAHKHIKI